MAHLCQSRHAIATRSARGFSLVELLVTILIIGLLIAVLIPALGAARTVALNATCMANEKQVGTAIHAYAADFDGVIPYGPAARPTSIADFYVVDGMVTSQLSILSGGKPMGVGLMLDGYLQQTPQIVFCPDNDQPVDAERELNKVGKTQAISGYFYRHGSNTLATSSTPRATWDDHIQLEALGLNGDGEPIRALLADQQFVVNPPLPLFNVVVRTNHERQSSNVLYDDGHVRTLDNSNDRYTANIGAALHLGPEKMLGVFENADVD